jgi:hypothetical protein
VGQLHVCEVAIVGQFGFSGHSYWIRKHTDTMRACPFLSAGSSMASCLGLKGRGYIKGS